MWANRHSFLVRQIVLPIVELEYVLPHLVQFATYLDIYREGYRDVLGNVLGRAKNTALIARLTPLRPCIGRCGVARSVIS